MLLNICLRNIPSKNHSWAKFIKIESIINILKKKCTFELSKKTNTMKKSLFLLFSIYFFSLTAQTSYTINVGGASNTFVPAILTINVGDTVTWNNTGGYHNVNATLVTYPNNPEGFGNGVASAPWSFQWVFTMQGTYDYQCDPHIPLMVGVVIANAIQIPGCTDSTACNYDPTATIDDSSCIFPDGCTDSLACNYNSLATCDDGSCLTTYGCTDSTAINFNVNASCDDGTCTYPLPLAENLFFSEYACLLYTSDAADE